MAKRCGQRVEVLSGRSENTQVFANPDGTSTFTSTAVPARVHRPDGSWVPVDTTLRARPDGTVAPEALTPATRQLLDAAKRAYTTRTRDPELPIPAVAGFVGGWVLFHDVLPAVHGAMTSDAIRTAAYAVDVPAGEEINGGGVKFSPPGSPDAGQNQRTVSVVGQWQAVETMRIVFPSPFAIAPPRLELSAPRFP